MVRNPPDKAGDVEFDPRVETIPWRREACWATVRGGHRRVRHDLDTKQQQLRT